METRSVRTYLLFCFGFIFMLICAVGAFIYGYQLGTTRTEARLEVPIKAVNVNKEVATYPQQDLVTFYHTILAPYQSFQSNWFEDMDLLDSGDATLENAAVLKKLSKLAEQQYTQASSVSMQATSPLLQYAQTNYLRALKLFGIGLSNVAGKANTLPSSLIPEQLQKDEYIQNAIKYSLAAQEQLFDAILKWSHSTKNTIPDEVTFDKVIPLTKWDTYPLAVKNVYIAHVLGQNQNFDKYYPHDITAKIDQMISQGQASQLKVTNIAQLLDVLQKTDAVRTDDFAKNKMRLYKQEIMPQLPFFYE